ncbi:MAG TPA: SGNH/GDSL hydrolase family protein [Vicinamibacterales bacterium]|jgi:lysophospholipase L1-like esterase
MMMRASIVAVLCLGVAYTDMGAAQQPQVLSGAQSSVPSATCPEMATALGRLLQNDVRNRDWAQLARYRADNETVKPPAAGDARVVFMGDSITDGWQQPRYGGFFPGKPYIDRGISGQTTPQMLVRFRPDVIDLKPKVVVILAGTNDIAGNTGPTTNEEIEANLTSMSELAHANNIRVVVASVTPVSAYHVATPTSVPQTTLRPMTRIRALNDWIKSYAEAHNDVYLDYFSAMVDQSGVMQEELTADDLHPNIKGYAIMAPLAEAAIARALK